MPTTTDGILALTRSDVVESSILLDVFTEELDGSEQPRDDVVTPPSDG